MNPYDVSWSPDGRFLAVVNSGSLTLQVYDRYGTIGGPVSTGNYPLGVSWSPDGRYLVVPNASDNTLQTFAFDGKNTPVPTPVLLGGTIPTGNTPYSVGWSPDGNYIATVCSADNILQVFTANYGADMTPQGVNNSITFGNASLGSVADLNVRLLGSARVLINGQVCDESA